MAKFLCCIFKSSIFWIITTAIFCLSINVGINIFLAYLWSFLINKFLSSYLYLKYIIILILFLYNYLILRKLVISWLYEWQFPFQIFSIYKERQNFITFLKVRLRNFINAIDVILDVNYKISKRETDDIESFLHLFEDQFNVFNDLYNCVKNGNNNNLVTYKMSKCQIKYYNLLKSINRILNENNTKINLLKLKNNKNSFSEETLKMNNFTVNQNFENKKNLTHLNMLLKEYKKIISKYDWDNYTYMSPSYLFNLLFNDTFGSLSFYSIQFKKRLQNYEFEEKFTPKGKVHYTLIRNKKEKENNLIEENNIKNVTDDKLLLFCLPNGGCYELIQKAKIDFYLSKGFSFLCWNYKGYGYSKGTANFSNCKKDVLEVYDTVVNNPKYNFKKICVMGHSIGGVAACYLAKNRHVDLLISDRNFCDLPRLVKNLFCGKYLSCLIKCLFIGKTDNIINFYSFSNKENNNMNGIIKLNNNNNDKNNNLNNVNRIIIYSPVDMLILNDATVKSGVARYIIKNHIIYKNNNSNKIIKNKENILDIVFNKNEKSRFINNFLELIHSHYDKSAGKNNNLNNIIILEVKNKDNKKNSNEFINLKGPNESEDQAIFSFFDKFFGICCDNLNFLSINKISLRRETIFIDNFFNNLLIWGVQGGNQDDIDYFEFKSYKGKQVLKEAYDILKNYSLINKDENQINISKKSGIVNLLSEDLKKILDVMDNLDIIFNKNEINNYIKNKNKEKDNISNISNSDNNGLKEKLISDSEEESEIITNLDIETNEDKIINNKSFYDKLNNIKGSIKLFKTFAGHNGLLKPDERENFYKFLLSTGILG